MFALPHFPPSRTPRSRTQPWLESLHALADVPATSAFPKRLGIVLLGNGINEDHWSTEGQGAGMKLGKTPLPSKPSTKK